MTSSLDPEALLAAYDSQLRAREREVVPAGVVKEWDGPLLRITGGPHGGFIGYRDLAGLDGPQLDDLISRQVRHFAARGERFEWKLHGHDRPTDLPERLRAHGFEPEELEAVVIGLAAPLADPDPALPEGVTMRVTVDRRDFDRLAEMNTQAWGFDLAWLAEMLSGELASDPECLKVWVVEAGDRVVSAAWARFNPGTDFMGLWGGTTAADFRGKGIYRALVGVRAAEAVARGYTYLQVDASPDSRPILERLGLVMVTTTTPYIWQP